MMVSVTVVIQIPVLSFELHLRESVHIFSYLSLVSFIVRKEYVLMFYLLFVLIDYNDDKMRSINWKVSSIKNSVP